MYRVVRERPFRPESPLYRILPDACFLIGKAYLIIFLSPSAGRADSLGRMLFIPIISQCFVRFAISLHSGTQENNGFARALAEPVLRPPPTGTRRMVCIFVYSVSFTFSRITGRVTRCGVRKSFDSPSAIRCQLSALRCSLDCRLVSVANPVTSASQLAARAVGVFSKRPSCFHLLASGTVKRITDRVQLS